MFRKFRIVMRFVLFRQEKHPNPRKRGIVMVTLTYEDCPEMTPEILKQFKRMHSKKRTKESVSLRVSADTLEKAKAYGKGYTAFLSRLLDVAINNEEIVKKCI